MWSMLPNEAMYPYTAKEARDRGELEVWRANFRTNCACAGAIELAIHRDFDGMYLKDGCAKSVIDQYGYISKRYGKSSDQLAQAQQASATQRKAPRSAMGLYSEDTRP